MDLTQKERMLLEDQQKHEQLCIDKYNEYAGQANDASLKQMFETFAQQEQQHLDTVNQILGGQVPSTNQGQQGQQNQNQQQVTQQGGTQATSNAGSQNDALLCEDMLMTEKHVSHAYNSAIFEFTSPDVRQALNHIQKEEQQHGEGIFNYMQQNGMYTPK